MRADSSTAVYRMLSLFLVITPFRVKYSVSKDSALRAPITKGITLILIFHIRDISNARFWYFDSSSASLFLTQKSIGIGTSIMNVSWFFLLISTILAFLASISRSALMLKSYKISITLSALCSYQCLAVSKLYSLHSFQWTIVVTLSWRFLYFLYWASFEHSLKICITASSFS